MVKARGFRDEKASTTSESISKQSLSEQSTTPYLHDAVDHPGESVQRSNQDVEESQAREDLLRTTGTVNDRQTNSESCAEAEQP